jgi:hypothetical protein
MSYRSYDGDVSLWHYIFCIAVALFLIFGLNSCNEDKWNDGVCPQCEVRYELRGVSRGTKYYACPECEEVIERYF